MLLTAVQPESVVGTGIVRTTFTSNSANLKPFFFPEYFWNAVFTVFGFLPLHCSIILKLPISLKLAAFKIHSKLFFFSF